MKKKGDGSIFSVVKSLGTRAQVNVGDQEMLHAKAGNAQDVISSLEVKQLPAGEPQGLRAGKGGDHIAF